MQAPRRRQGAKATRSSVFSDSIRRAFAEFLTLPTGIIGGFLLLAAATYLLDHDSIGWLVPLRRALQGHAFGSPQVTSGLLGSLAAGLTTVTSITFSLLLLAVQQSAASLTNQVFDQFLRRRLNQTFFGYFVGLALYALIVLATVDPPYNPVFGATLALFLTVVALYLLLLLLYTTINQMRPVAIVEAIHDHTLAARARQLALIRRTRRAPGSTGAVTGRVSAADIGFVTSVNLDALAVALGPARDGVEIVLLVSIGDYVAFHDPLAEVRGGALDDVRPSSTPRGPPSTSNGSATSTPTRPTASNNS